MRRLVIAWLKISLVHDHELSDADIALIARHLIWVMTDAKMLLKNVNQSIADDDDNVNDDDEDDDDDDEDRGNYTAEQRLRLRGLVNQASLPIRRLLRAFVEALPPRRRYGEYHDALVAVLQSTRVGVADRAVRTSLASVLVEFGLDGLSGDSFHRLHVAIHIQRDMEGKSLRAGNTRSKES